MRFFVAPSKTRAKTARKSPKPRRLPFETLSLWKRFRPKQFFRFALPGVGHRLPVTSLTRRLRRCLARWLDGPGFAATYLDVGQWGEWWAERELRRQGYRILFRRWTDGVGELDLVAWYRGRLVFVEVKARRDLNRIGAVQRAAGDGLSPDAPRTPVLLRKRVYRQLAKEAFEAVDLEKQGRITRAALRFKKKHGLLSYPTRFDVIVVVATDPRHPVVKHSIGAFDATGDNGSMY
jgi:putative endonuclease